MVGNGRLSKYAEYNSSIAGHRPITMRGIWAVLMRAQYELGTSHHQNALLMCSGFLKTAYSDL